MTDEFNHRSGWHQFHLFHMALMITGMGFVMAANAAGSNATLGDGLYQTIAMIGVAIGSTLTTGIPVGLDMISNLFEGDVLPTTYEVGDMHTGMDHSGVTHDFSDAAEHVSHTEHLERGAVDKPVLTDEAKKLLDLE